MPILCCILGVPALLFEVIIILGVLENYAVMCIVMMVTLNFIKKYVEVFVQLSRTSSIIIPMRIIQMGHLVCRPRLAYYKFCLITAE